MLVCFGLFPINAGFALSTRQGVQNQRKMSDRTFYLSKAKSLCEAFSKGSSPEELSSHFRSDGIVYEHGPSSIKELPFLGKQFKGTQSIIEYFQIIGKYLKVVDNMVFNDWTCDVLPEDVEDHDRVKAVVTTRGRTRFEYASTGKR